MIRDFLSRINPKQKKYFIELRSAILAFPEIEESVEIDELRGDWCPAYRVNGKDLVWVHFDDRMWVAFPIEPSFAKKVLQDENLDGHVVNRVREAEDVGEVKWVTVDLKSGDQLESVIPLLRLRHSHLMGSAAP